MTTQRTFAALLTAIYFAIIGSSIARIGLAPEEKVLFPYIKQLEADKLSGTAASSPFGTVQNPINMMEMEHELVGKNMEEIRKITHNYTLPEGACASYQQLFRLLAEFEEDLQIHIHLENNILFPKAVALEKTM